MRSSNFLKLRHRAVVCGRPTPDGLINKFAVQERKLEKAAKRYAPVVGYHPPGLQARRRRVEQAWLRQRRAGWR